MPSSLDTTLLQLLATRFSHDITGPIGAINNGVEFMEESDEAMKEQAMELISSSAEQAIARVQFFRYIYGLNKDSSVSIDIAKKQRDVERFYAGSNISLIWNIQGELSSADCQIMCNLIYLAASGLIRGGIVTIMISGGAFDIKADGQTVKIDPLIREAIIAREAHHPTTKTIQAYYTALLMAQQRSHVTMHCGDDYCNFIYQTSAHALAGSM